MANSGEIDIFGVLRSGTGDLILARAEEIKDYGKNKMQSVINNELYTSISNLEVRIQDLNSFEFQVYPDLTTAQAHPSGNVLYLIGPATINGEDKYVEYVYDGTKPTLQEKWIRIGDTSVDLSGYATTGDLATALEDYTPTDDLPQIAEDANLENRLVVTIGGVSYVLESEKIQKPAAPTLTVGGTFTASKAVTITSSTTTRYTQSDDGTPPADPTATSGSISKSFSLSASDSVKSKTYIVKAVAIKNGMVSDVTSETYYLLRQVKTPTISASGDDYSNTRNINITCDTNGAIIHYTDDGTVPTASSAEYTEPINISSNKTIKAIAVLTDWENSEIKSSSYTVGKVIMKYGYSTHANITASEIASLTGSKKTNSPAGHYDIENSEGEAAYLWICIDPTQSITSIVSNTYDVPKEAPTSVGQWKCYRSTLTHKTGLHNFDIA